MDLEAVQPAQLLGHLAQLAALERLEVGLVDVLDVDLVERIAQEDLRDEQPAVLGEGQRVGPRHAGGDLDRLVAAADIDLADQEGRPGHGAVFSEGDVVGHSDRRIEHAVDLAGIDLDAIDGLADHRAGEKLIILVESKAMDAVEPRAGHQQLLAVLLGRRLFGLLRHRAPRHRQCQRQRRHKTAQTHTFLRPSTRRGL